eukprot:CAMPEP_0114144812 /NCGR_PEP_ID=MMETSP0043_2-20121206/19728_1 /TAXON_ID=464988 /ORGANISM="Hemiselmis andersenii, Strain CCMP644" /LENGTH=494 /DNA_ID=CAMNT_0001239219 /DNA_START=137 /DNA_END=1617 /DNA_ORIENTATION=-
MELVNKPKDIVLDENGDRVVKKGAPVTMSGFMSVVAKGYTDPDANEKKTRERLIHFHNVQPAWELDIIRKSEPTGGSDTDGPSGLVSHLAHIFALRGTKIDAVENYVPKNRNDPSRTMPVYHLEPRFKSKQSNSFIMDFNHTARQTVGRTFSCEVFLMPEFLNPDDWKLVSRVHCAFVATADGGLRMQDTSQNGTMHNETLVSKDNVKCFPGDMITFGGEKSRATYELSLLEMGYVGPAVVFDAGGRTKSPEEILEEKEQELENLPSRQLMPHSIPTIQREIIKGDAMMAMLHSSNTVPLWADIIDCDTLLTCKVFRTMMYGANHYLALHACAGTAAVVQDLVGANHALSAGCVGGLLHLLELGIAMARNHALLAMERLVEASAEARYIVQRDGGMPVLERAAGARPKPRMDPDFAERAKAVLEKVREIHVGRPMTALPPGKLYAPPAWDPFTPYGERGRMRHQSAISSVRRRAAAPRARPSTAGSSRGLLGAV